MTTIKILLNIIKFTTAFIGCMYTVYKLGKIVFKIFENIFGAICYFHLQHGPKYRLANQPGLCDLGEIYFYWRYTYVYLRESFS